MNDYNTQNRTALIQKLETGTGLDQYYGRDQHKLQAQLSILTFILGLVAGMVALAIVKACDTIPQPIAVRELSCQYCHALKVTNYKSYRKYHQITKGA